MDHLQDFAIGNLRRVYFLKNEKPEDAPRPPCDWESFHKFPNDSGWALDHSYVLKLGGKPDSKARVNPNYGNFLQTWLFFGLIFTIVQKDGKPILKKEDLVDGDFVTTRKLPEAIADWDEWESGNRKGRLLRMIRTEKVLDIARHVVRINLADNIPLKYSTSPEKPPYVHDIVAMSLMILGETLSAAKANIMEKTASGLRGWHGDDHDGWGPPRWVFEEMRSFQWCQREIYLFRRQFHFHATLLLGAFMAYQSATRPALENHKSCTQDICRVKSEDNGAYTQNHAYDCDGSACTEMDGPGMNAIEDLLDKGKRPLLIFEEKDTQAPLRPSVIEWRDGLEYATISHVWSDGYGNETENKLRICQLRLIRRHLKKFQISHDKPLAFWMDTLVIPVGQTDEQKKLKKIGIQQIFNTFQDSTYTIVLDLSLSRVDHEPKRPAQTAMRILASSWMRRLWTLQEAYLSRTLHIAFQERDQVASHFTEFRTLCDDLEKTDYGLATSLITTVQRQLRHNIMDHERVARDQYLFKRSLKLPPKKAAILIANAWKATRWRTTSNEFHETLALSTLLNLDYKGTEIESVGLQKWESKNRQTNKAAEKEKQEKKDDLMAEFWIIFSKRWPEAIPPGMIFLPGPRINKEGFGWAPRTWMSAHRSDFPDPLSVIKSTGQLDLGGDNGFKGLKVRYPGFLLHPQNRGTVLGTDKQNRKFKFPVDQSLLEWYSAEPADSADRNAAYPYLGLIKNGTAQLAIILSRPQPRDVPPEIGLMVQIYRTETFPVMDKLNDNQVMREDKGKGPDRIKITNIKRHGLFGMQDDTALEDDEIENVFHCEIIHRVWVARETKAAVLTANHGRIFDKPDFKSQPAPGESQLVPEESQPVSGDDDTEEHMDVPEIMIPKNDDQICIGEVLGSDQAWYVDGFFPDRNKENAVLGESDEPVSQSFSQRSSSFFLSLFPSLPRREASNGESLPRSSASGLRRADTSDDNPLGREYERASLRPRNTWHSLKNDDKR